MLSVVVVDVIGAFEGSSERSLFWDHWAQPAHQFMNHIHRPQGVWARLYGSLANFIILHIFVPSVYLLPVILDIPCGQREKNANTIKLVNSIKHTVSLSNVGFLRRRPSSVGFFHFPCSSPRWQLRSGGEPWIQIHHSLPSISYSWSPEPPPAI